MCNLESLQPLTLIQLLMEIQELNLIEFKTYLMWLKASMTDIKKEIIILHRYKILNKIIKVNTKEKVGMQASLIIKLTHTMFIMISNRIQVTHLKCLKIKISFKIKRSKNIRLNSNHIQTCILLCQISKSKGNLIHLFLKMLKSQLTEDNMC